jgi:hypothetical protein
MLLTAQAYRGSPYSHRMTGKEEHLERPHPFIEEANCFLDFCTQASSSRAKRAGRTAPPPRPRLHSAYLIGFASVRMQLANNALNAGGYS